MFDILSDYIVLLARLMLAIPFLYSSLDGLKDNTNLVIMLKSKNVPAPTLLIPTFLMLQFIIAVFLIMGVLPQLAALLLALFTLNSALIFHSYWKIDNPIQRRLEATSFTMHLGLIGGLALYVII